MKRPYLKNLCHCIPIYFLFLFITSCSSSKNIKYFQDISDTAKVTAIPAIPFAAPTIQPDDILTITVVTVDPLASQVINMGNIPGSANSSLSVNPAMTPQQIIAGYLIDKNGNVELPVLGKLKLAGLTTTEAKGVIQAKAATFFNDPTVSVRFANFKISVTGEVGRPSSYVVPNEKVSLLDALAMAGDITIYGKRENVLLIREGDDGSKLAYRFNLNNSNIMKSPYFYLKQNDVIYVEPSKSKVAANDIAQTRNITIISSALSVLIVLLTRLK